MCTLKIFQLAFEFFFEIYFMSRSLCLTIFLLTLISFIVEAQSYVTAMGLRMGTDFGISIQQKILEKTTLQGIVSTSAAKSATTATLLIQTHQPLVSKRFNFYIGGGFHQRWIDELSEDRDIRRGITAIAGAEMTLGRFNLAWDYKPLYHLNATQIHLKMKPQLACDTSSSRRANAKRKRVSSGQIHIKRNYVRKSAGTGSSKSARSNVQKQKGKGAQGNIQTTCLVLAIFK